MCGTGAIYIFPTKALAQDQLRALRALCNAGATALFGTLVATCAGYLLLPPHRLRHPSCITTRCHTR